MNKELQLCSNRIRRNVKSYREQRYWTKTKLAMAAGITNAAVHDIEIGDRIPSLEVIIKLADAFKVSMFDVIGIDCQSLDKDQEAFFAAKWEKINKLSEEEQQLVFLLVEKLSENKK